MKELLLFILPILTSSYAAYKLGFLHGKSRSKMGLPKPNLIVGGYQPKERTITRKPPPKEP